jgi:histidinol-phosphatase (PHP family)
MGMLPPDGHVHSEWSWDAFAGSMERSCARAVEFGLPSIAFTEHVDLTRWVIAPDTMVKLRENAAVSPPAATIVARVGSDGRLTPPSLDLDDYQACLEQCRDRYPNLHILSGVEIEAPHWHAEEVRTLLADFMPERILGGLHSIEVEGDAWEANSLYLPFAPAGFEPDAIVRAYLAEVLRMVESSEPFQALAHIEYAARGWPASAGTFNPNRFEEEFRVVLQALARSGRALEVNTSAPYHAEVIRWWHEAGGEAVSFGSDAHEPSEVAHGFSDAVAMVESQGFRPGRDQHDFWIRRA